MSIEEEISEYKSGSMNARHVDSLLLDLIDHYESTKDLHEKYTEARAKLVAMESQEPLCVVENKNLAKLADGKGAKVYGCAPHMLYNPDYHSNLYAKPVPADKPAVAVPDGWKEIVESVAHIGVDFGYGVFVLSQEDISKARELLAAAPSRSKQR